MYYVPSAFYVWVYQCFWHLYEVDTVANPHFIDEKLCNRENKDLAQDCTVGEQDSLGLYLAPHAPEPGKLSKIWY